MIELPGPPKKLNLTHNEAEILCIWSLKMEGKNVVVAIVVIKQARKTSDLKQSKATAWGMRIKYCNAYKILGLQLKYGRWSVYKESEKVGQELSF